tara:strand:- start:961 stop:1245 length:285 start_codon:yes stop_codon:yes gene_type:complete
MMSEMVTDTMWHKNYSSNQPLLNMVSSVSTIQRPSHSSMLGDCSESVKDLVCRCKREHPQEEIRPWVSKKGKECKNNYLSEVKAKTVSPVTPLE